MVPFYTPLRNDTHPPPLGSPLGGWRAAVARALGPLDCQLATGLPVASRRAFLGVAVATGHDRVVRPGVFGVAPSVYVPSLGRDIVPELRLAGE